MPTNITSNMVKMYEEETDEQSSISEALWQKIGATVNALVDAKLANDTTITTLTAAIASANTVTLFDSWTYTTTIASFDHFSGGITKAVYVDTTSGGFKIVTTTSDGTVDVVGLPIPTIAVASNRFATLTTSYSGANITFTMKVWEIGTP
jgi:hypothetical protein